MAKKGTVFFDKERNNWRAAVTTPEGQRKTKRFATEETAQEWLVEQLNSINKSTFVEPDTITLGQWLIHWLNMYVKSTVKQRTYERYVSLCKHTNVMEDVSLQKIKPLQMQQLYANLEKTISAHTISKVHKVLSAAFKKATELEMLNKNIMTLVKPPKYRSKEIEIFSQEEITVLLTKLKEDKYYSGYFPLVLLAISTGARLGELLGLSWQDVDLKKKEINIRQSLQHSSLLGLFVETPKTKAGIRRISIPEETVKTLQELKTSKTSGKVIAFNVNEDFCFTTKNNTPFSPSNLNKIWHGILKNTGIPYKNFHVLRHTHATQLLANGIPIVEVSRRIGHSRTSHTLDLYGQAIPNYDEKLANEITKIFSLK